MLGDPRVKRRRFRALGQGGRLRIEEHHQIDVAGIIEFACAMLAESQHGEARTVAGIVGILQDDAAKIRHLGQNQIDAAAHRRIGEFAQMPRHRDHIPNAADIRKRHKQRMGVAVLPEGRDDLIARESAGAKCAKERGLRMHDLGVNLLGRLQREAPQAGRIVDDHPPQKR